MILSFYLFIPANADQVALSRFDAKSLNMGEIRSIVEEQLVARGISREQAREKLNQFSDEDILQLARNPQINKKTGFVIMGLLAVILITMLILLIISMIEKEKQLAREAKRVAKSLELKKKKKKAISKTVVKHSRGKKLCQKCNGSGFVPNALDQWGNRIECKYCKGTGREPENYNPAFTLPLYTNYGVVIEEFGVKKVKRDKKDEKLQNQNAEFTGIIYHQTGKQNLPVYTESGVVTEDKNKVVRNYYYAGGK